MNKVSALYKGKPGPQLTQLAQLTRGGDDEEGEGGKGEEGGKGDEGDPALRYKELTALIGDDKPTPGTHRHANKSHKSNKSNTSHTSHTSNTSHNTNKSHNKSHNTALQGGDQYDSAKIGQKQWNSEVKHTMRSAVATSIFSPHWGEERNLIRSVAALLPYRAALHEVFEYYCLWNNRRFLNVDKLNSTNFAKLCRDCHLVLDPRGAKMNADEAHGAMQSSGCWVTPGEVDVVFVRR